MFRSWMIKIVFFRFFIDLAFTNEKFNPDGKSEVAANTGGIGGTNDPIRSMTILVANSFSSLLQPLQIWWIF